MSEDSGFTRDSLVARAKAMILTPKTEWPKIEGEPGTIRGIFMGYGVPLAATAPACSFFGGQIFGYGAFGFHYRPGLVTGLSTAIISYLMALAGLFVMMLIVDFLAPKFDGVAGRLNAFKLVAYAMTAGALAGVFGILPNLAWLGIVGLYSFYIFYTGVTPLMKVPEGKAIAFTAVTMLCAAILYLVIFAIIGSVAATFAPTPLVSNDEVTGNVLVPGVGTFDVGKLQAAAKQAEAQASGTTKAADPAALQGLLPNMIEGFARTSVQSAAIGAAGSNAEGQYSKGDQQFSLSVTDMSAMGALASMGAAMGVQSNREDADGYERTQTVDGKIVTEKWSKSGKTGEYGTTVGNRFMVKAEGSADDIAVLKGAVAAVDAAKLEALAR